MYEINRRDEIIGVVHRTSKTGCFVWVEDNALPEAYYKGGGIVGDRVLLEVRRIGEKILFCNLSSVLEFAPVGLIHLHQQENREAA